ncbi:Nup85 nucleoporin-domain-containing protein [Aspergillus avenaceus]|uniref:Nuclear pore complex protein Nup85 n=1 Tax=Aspergillus avenaceus TaxID=36643 RepID=A0A5N6TK33_ASPAV|nr:Nup85 nucleoporin-domain-containing protein [Aspergillus avenaceus]
MSFKFPLDSSPPSTPNKSRNLFSLSETPAAGPPSASHSFTPRGPPPSTVFGSSQMSARSETDSPGSLFTKSGNINPNDSIFGSSIASFDFPATRAKKPAPAKSFAPSQSFYSVNNDSQFGDSTNFGPSNSFAPSEMEKDPNGDKADSEIDIGDAPTNANRLSFLDSGFGKPAFLQPAAQAHRKPIYSNPDNAKRPKLDEKWTHQSPLRKTKLSPKKDSAIPSIVRNFASRSRIAAVEEPSEVIINTEDEICRMYDEIRHFNYQDDQFHATLSDVCGRLSTVWKTYAENDGKSRGAGVGPGDRASDLSKASFLGSLLLQLHHPLHSSSKQGAFSGPLGLSVPRNLVLAGPRASTPTPMPKVLLDWLNSNHPQSADLQTLKDVEPNPTASSNFWEILKASVLRGHVSKAAELLRAADFNYARSALEDGLPQAGYRGAQLQNIQKCVNRALQILDSCPSTQYGDWDVKGTEWAMYRKRVLAAVNDLEEFAEGSDQQEEKPAPVGNRFQAINFGLKPAASEFSFAQSARMAESRVPWMIYQNLRSLYRILLGDTSAIMNHAQDWVEATVGLTVWWDGEDDDVDSAQGAGKGFGASINTHFLRPRISKPQSFGDDTEDPYLRRLELAFSSATNVKSDDAGFRINSLSSLEVGLASVFEGNVDGVIELLQTWSLCVASAVAEIASAAGWLETAAGEKSLPGLSANDLMVLSYGQDNAAAKSRVQKDDILRNYASGLFDRGSIENAARSAWELAIEVLSRLDDNGKMQKSVSELLEKLPLNTPEQVDKVVLLCSELGLESEGRRVSERFGDSTISKTEEYGLALICYARAHNRRKVKSVVDLLISYSLVQSRAYPASTDLDEQLESMIREPKACLSAVAAVDEEAASILQFYFSGYATLRRFYETRDEAVGLQEGQRPRFKPLARRRAAAQALVAVITSAADSIYGGLYDPDRDSAVQVDGLLALLGEALPFINQSTPIFSVPQQFAILSAIEDLETITPRVYAQCEECFSSTLIEYQSSKQAGTDPVSNDCFVVPPWPRALLKKSVSSGTASSTFSFIGSDMIESARNRSGSVSAGSSGVLVPRSGDTRPAYHERGWDWRVGLPEDTKGEAVLRMLRMGLAKGLSFGALGSV